MEIVINTPDITKQIPRTQWAANTKLSCQALAELAFLEDSKTTIATSSFDDPKESIPLVLQCFQDAFKSRVINAYDMHDFMQSLQGCLRLKDVEIPQEIINRSGKVEGQPSSPQETKHWMDTSRL